MAIALRAFGASGSTGSAATLTVPLPAGVVDGDVLIAFIAANTTLGTAPAGWTLIKSSGGSGVISGTYYRVASSEPASYNWTSLSTGSKHGVIAAFTGVDTSDVLSGTPVSRNNNSGTTGTGSALTTDVANALVFGVEFAAGGTAGGDFSSWSIGGNSMTEIFDTAVFRAIGVATYVQPTAGSTGNLTVNMATALLNTAQVFALVPAPAVPITGAAALSGTGSLTADGHREHTGALTITGSGALDASGTVTKLGATALSGAGSLDATGTRTVFGAAALAGTGSLDATGVVTISAAAALSGTGSLDATGRLIVSGAVALSGTGSLTADGSLITGNLISGAALLSGAGSLDAAGVAGKRGAATLTGVGSLSASGQYAAFARALLSGAGSLSVDGTVTEDPIRVQQERIEYIAYLRMMKELLGR